MVLVYKRNPVGISSSDLSRNGFNFFGSVYRYHPLWLFLSLSSSTSRASSSVNESLVGLSRFRENEIWPCRVPSRTLETFEDRRFYLELSIFEPREKLKLPEAAGSESEHGKGRYSIVQHRTIRSYPGHRSWKWAATLYIKVDAEE